MHKVGLLIISSLVVCYIVSIIVKVIYRKFIANSGNYKKRVFKEISNVAKIPKEGYCLENRCFHDVYVLRTKGHYEFLFKKKCALFNVLVYMLIIPVPVVINDELRFYHLGWYLVARSIFNSLNSDGFFDGNRMVLYGSSCAGPIVRVISDMVKGYNRHGVERVVTFNSPKSLLVMFSTHVFPKKRNCFSYTIATSMLSLI